jgi:ABC-type Na+ efflux pump permease subunit
MLALWRANMKRRLSVIADGLEVAALVSGSCLALMFGKFLAAGIFGLFAVGVARRFFRRGEGVRHGGLPLWGTLVRVFVAVVAAGVIVEAINLPIRYDQAGFEKSNLLIVAALVLMFYALAGSFLRRLLAGRATQPIAKHELGRNT